MKNKEENKKQEVFPDALFRRKLGNMEYEYSDASWWVMEEALKKKQRRRLAFRIFYRLLAGVSICWWLYAVFDLQVIRKTEKNVPDFFDDRQKGAIHNKVNEAGYEKNMVYEQETNFRQQKKEGEHSRPVISDKKEKNEGEGVEQRSAIVREEGVPQSLSHTVIVKEKNMHYLASESYTRYFPYEEATVKILSVGRLVNSPYADYAPVINADGSEMYFTSRRPLSEKEKKKGEGRENIYYTRKVNGQWVEAVCAPWPINSIGSYNSAVALSNDGQRIFLYRDDKYGNGDLYESVLKGDTWSEPERLPEPINSRYHEPSLSVSPDGNTIYFVSDRPGGKGKLDIWYCTRDKSGKWGEARNMGAPVNTADDEEGVFIHPDGKTLYFSSRGHKGSGGYDIYYTRFENGRWSEPVNMGSVINTPYDDVYFVVEANGRYAYYASRREDGMGEKDIYCIEFVFPEEQRKGAELTLFKGHVLDKREKFPLEAEIELTDLGNHEKITTLQSNAATGAFMISLPAGRNYAITVKKEGYLFYSENFDIPAGEGYKEIEKTILLDKLTKGARVILRNIFYDYDKADLRPESMTELDKVYKLMQDNPAIKIELSAHTDSRGSDAYNNKLSQERAQSCVDYLIKKGIDKSRIIAKGYGKQQPVIDDETINKMNSEAEKEAAHQQNRRTEIKIIEN